MIFKYIVIANICVTYERCCYKKNYNGKKKAVGRKLSLIESKSRRKLEITTVLQLAIFF